MHTHSEHPIPGDGTRPFMTVAQALSKIPRSARLLDPLHNPDSMKPLAMTPLDPNQPLPRTITCSGGVGNYHYSGTRNYTRREYATLQGFPINYSFTTQGAKKQIGNAFPPCVVRVLLTHVREWLEKVDKVKTPIYTDEIAGYGLVSPPQYIEIVDSDAEDSEVEFLQSRPRRSTSQDSDSSGTLIQEELDMDEMDLDDQDQDESFSAPCIDSLQFQED